MVVDSTVSLEKPPSGEKAEWAQSLRVLGKDFILAICECCVVTSK